jgi:hypothetical protein
MAEQSWMMVIQAIDEVDDLLKRLGIPIVR